MNEEGFSESLIEKLEELKNWDQPRTETARESKLIDTRTVFLNFKEGHISSNDVAKMKGSFFLPDDRNFAYYEK